MKEIGWWILDETNTPQFIGTGMESYKEHSTGGRMWVEVKKDRLGPFGIETLFVGCDVNSPEGIEPPLLFETIITFRGCVLEIKQWPSWTKATSGHFETKVEVLAKGWRERVGLEWMALAKRSRSYWRKLRKRAGELLE